MACELNTVIELVIGSIPVALKNGPALPGFSFLLPKGRIRSFCAEKISRVWQRHTPIHLSCLLICPPQKWVVLTQKRRVIIGFFGVAVLQLRVQLWRVTEFFIGRVSEIITYKSLIFQYFTEFLKKFDSQWFVKTPALGLHGIYLWGSAICKSPYFQLVSTTQSYPLFRILANANFR